jgi:hypothetical protein
MTYGLLATRIVRVTDAHRMLHAVFIGLAKAGIAVHAYDAFSFGRSQPDPDKKCLVWHYKSLVCASLVSMTSL